jgi:hypothetical protein
MMSVFVAPHCIHSCCLVPVLAAGVRSTKVQVVACWGVLLPHVEGILGAYSVLNFKCHFVAAACRGSAIFM